MSSHQTDQAAIDEQKVIGNRSVDSESRSEKEQRRAASEFKHTKTKGQLTMNVRIYSPFHDYYDGDAFSITAENATGPFDILPRHHNFISLLCACDLVIRSANGGQQKVVISGGIMHVKADQVIVFLDV